MTITLPDEMRASLEARAKAAGYESVDAFVGDLASDDDLFADVSDPAVQLRLKELVDVGLASGPSIPVTPEFWDRLYARVAEGLAAK